MSSNKYWLTEEKKWSVINPKELKRLLLYILHYLYFVAFDLLLIYVLKYYPLLKESSSTSSTTSFMLAAFIHKRGQQEQRLRDRKAWFRRPPPPSSKNYILPNLLLLRPARRLADLGNKNASLLIIIYVFLLYVTLCIYYNNQMKNCLWTQLWTLLVIENSLNKLWSLVAKSLVLNRVWVKSSKSESYESSECFTLSLNWILFIRLWVSLLENFFESRVKEKKFLPHLTSRAVLKTSSLLLT